MRPRWTARSFTTGRAPGKPRQTEQVWMLRGSPKDSSQPQNIFVLVLSCTWISRPMTGSYSPTGGAPVEADSLLQRIGGAQQAVLAEGRARELEAERKPVAQAAGNRDGRNARQRHGDGAEVVEVH